MNVTKHELCTKVAKRLIHLSQNDMASVNVTVNDLRTVFDIFTEEILTFIAEGSRIEIRGFGCFKPVLKKKRIGRNPRTGEEVAIPPYRAPYFKFSKDAQRIFDQKFTPPKKDQTANV